MEHTVDYCDTVVIDNGLELLDKMLDEVKVDSIAFDVIYDAMCVLMEYNTRCFFAQSGGRV